MIKRSGPASRDREYPRRPGLDLVNGEDRPELPGRGFEQLQAVNPCIIAVSLMNKLYYDNMLIAN